MFNRGLNSGWILSSAEERDCFYELLCRKAQNHKVNIYHYCVMSNHFHLAIEVLDTAVLSSFVSALCSQYSKNWHRHHRNGNGTIWQGRFKSIVVQKELYLNRLGRYIEQNPLRAQIVNSAEDYKWSSARAYTEDHSDPLVDPRLHPYRSNWGASEEECQTNYREYLKVAPLEEDDIFSSRNECFCLGDEAFQAKLMQENGRMKIRSGRPKKQEAS
ncbi:MAG: Transposase IS200 like protein [Lentisphaerae bacterium ADurb.Bin242]|nr:MAG: Transposase IS200 like protein [Lentisphaerae bacterium ADurb.Bin242]